MRRRHLLAALGAAALFPWPAWGRRRRVPEASLPDGPVLLGWRWVPGERLAYRCVTRREAGDEVTSRAEAWAWLVRDVDREGVATLEGRLTGFGGGVVRDGEPLPDEALATAMAVEQVRADRVVTVRIGLDGALVYLDPLSFADSLPHRLLALRVPAFPVAPHDEWPLPGLVRPFATLVPPDVGVETHATGRLVEWTSRDGLPVATIETSGSVRATSGPTVHVTGTAWWDAAHGGMIEREIHARFTPSSPAAPNPGALAVTFRRERG